VNRREPVSESNNPLPLTLPAIWPDGLHSLEFTTGFAQSHFDVARVQSVLQESRLVYRERGSELLFPLIGEGDTAGFWGRAEIRPATDEALSVADTLIDWYVWRENPEQRAVPDESYSLTSLPCLLQQLARVELESSFTVVTGKFTLHRSDWTPSMSLPVQVPGVLENAVGTPEITGFEFTFRDKESELRRAEISTHPKLDRFFVNLVVVVTLLPCANFYQRACDLLSQHLRLFASRTPGEVIENA
jgi:hypothetical protein